MSLHLYLASVAACIVVPIAGGIGLALTRGR